MLLWWYIAAFSRLRAALLSILFSTTLGYETSRELGGLQAHHALGQVSWLACLLMSILSDFLHLTEIMDMRKSDFSYNLVFYFERQASLVPIIALSPGICEIPFSM